MKQALYSRAAWKREEEDMQKQHCFISGYWEDMHKVFLESSAPCCCLSSVVYFLSKLSFSCFFFCGLASPLGEELSIPRDELHLGRELGKGKFVNLAVLLKSLVVTPVLRSCLQFPFLHLGSDMLALSMSF